MGLITTQAPESTACPSLFSTQSSLDIGIESAQIQTYGYASRSYTSPTNLKFIGPSATLRQALIYKGYGFIDISASGTAGRIESQPSFIYKDGYRYSLRTFTFQVGLEGRIGGEIDLLNKQLNLRPYIGFGWNKYRSKVIGMLEDRPDYPLINLNFYRPSIGCDWRIDGQSSSLFGGIGFEVPWGTLQTNDPEDGPGDGYIRTPLDFRNDLNAARFGLKASIGGIFAINSSIRLVARSDYYSIYARGAPTLGQALSSYVPVSGQVESLRGTLGITADY